MLVIPLRSADATGDDIGLRPMADTRSAATGNEHDRQNRSRIPLMRPRIWRFDLISSTMELHYARRGCLPCRSGKTWGRPKVNAAGFAVWRTQLVPP